MFKRVLFLLFAINIILIIVLVVSSYRREFKIHFFDVGQGDAIYVRTAENHDILIDGGPDDTVLSKLGEAMPFYDREIDIVIVSHPHADHISGLISVLQNYKVKNVYLSGASHTTYEYLELLRQLAKRPETRKVKVDHPITLQLGDETALSFLYPDFDVADINAPQFTNSNLNNTSLVVKMTRKGRSVLFTGDIEKDAEEYMLSKKMDVSADVLKVAHQGSRTSSAEPFLRAVHPRFAVISVGKNVYEHPHPDTLDRLRFLNIKLLRTDEEGDIVFSL